MSNLRKNIVATLAYYDAFDYPVTLYEVWHHLVDAEYFEERDGKDIGLNDVQAELKDLSFSSGAGPSIEEFRGFYFLRGRREIVGLRIAREKISSQKMKRLLFVVALIRFIPFVRMVGSTGRLSMKNAQLKSDWDILVVMKKGRIWTGRTLVTGLLHILGKRRHDNKVKDRVCLNCFISDNSLEIKTKDLYSANEYYYLIPLFDASGTYRRFQLNNSWIRKFKPNYHVGAQGYIFSVRETFISKAIQAIGEMILNFDFFESLLRFWEKKKILNNPKTQQAGSMIEANDEALIFLPNPHGPKVFEKFKENMGGSV